MRSSHCLERMSTIRSAEGVECAFERMAWVARSGEFDQLALLQVAYGSLSYSASRESGRSHGLPVDIRNRARAKSNWGGSRRHTYILHSSVLVDLALQVFENTLTEKRVCRHDDFDLRRVVLLFESRNESDACTRGWLAGPSKFDGCRQICPEGATETILDLDLYFLPRSLPTRSLLSTDIYKMLVQDSCTLAISYGHFRKVLMPSPFIEAATKHVS